MAQYEITFIARPDMSAQDVQKLAERYSGIITEMGGEIVKEESWGLRALTYQIKKYRKGHYYMLAVKSPDAALREVNRLMSLSDDVIRSLSVRVEEIEAHPSAMLQQAQRSAA